MNKHYNDKNYNDKNLDKINYSMLKTPPLILILNEI